jgi:predicted nucleotidyltransferase
LDSGFPANYFQRNRLPDAILVKKAQGLFFTKRVRGCNLNSDANPKTNNLYLSKKNEMIGKAKISEIVNKIAVGYNPDKIILIGSYADGTPNKDSDLDLLIIQETDLPPHKRGLDIRLSLIGSKVPIDILVYTNAEFEKEKNEKFSFLYSAIKTSEVLYERVG